MSELIKVNNKDIEFIASTNKHLPISIQGVAKASVRDVGEKYIAIYNVNNLVDQKVQITETEYTVIKRVFARIQSLESQELMKYATTGLLDDYKNTYEKE